MRWLGSVVLLTCYLSISKSSLFSNLRSNVISLLNKSPGENGPIHINGLEELSKKSPPERDGHLNEDRDREDGSLLQHPKTLNSNPISLNKRRSDMIINLDDVDDIMNLNEKHVDFLQDFLPNQDFRRKDSDSGSSSSSSRELKYWKQEFREHWLKKKFEALNESIPLGDQVNVVAARPWDVPCGDPNQYDMPWGTCVLAVECEAEYRIYRGDATCGRTRFVCCAIKVNVYDMYQGFDVSFDDKSLSTESDERKDHQGSKEKKRKKAKKDKKDRQKARKDRKRAIEKKIKNIVKEVRKLMNKQHRNSTRERKKKTKKLKKFLKKLKKQYRKDRKAVQNLEEKESQIIDRNLMIKLNQIKAMNQNFWHNTTFREILVNGTMTKKGARMLVEAYPELSEFIKLSPNTRRSGGGDEPSPVSLEYDVEYGYLYY